MTISSVSSSTDAATKAVQQPKPQKSAERKTEAPQPKAADESAKARQAQEKQANTSDQPRPVVNAEGQTTGRVINLTA